MKTQIWNKTTIVWHLDYHYDAKTNIEISDIEPLGPPVNRGVMFHTLGGLRITSNFSEDRIRTATLGLKIARYTTGPTFERTEIISRLKNLDESISEVTDDDGFSDRFQLIYTLQNGESFCDSAINKVKKLFKAFGVEDKDNFHLADFIVIQETLVKTKKDGWIPYGDYLRNKYKLPQVCSLYKRSIEIDGNLVINIEYKKSASNFFLQPTNHFNR